MRGHGSLRSISVPIVPSARCLRAPSSLHRGVPSALPPFHCFCEQPSCKCSLPCSPLLIILACTGSHFSVMLDWSIRMNVDTPSPQQLTVKRIRRAKFAVLDSPYYPHFYSNPSTTSLPPNPQLCSPAWSLRGDTPPGNRRSKRGGKM